MKKKLTSFRLNKMDIERLREISKENSMTKTSIIELALHEFFWRYQSQRNVKNT